MTNKQRHKPRITRLLVFTLLTIRPLLGPAYCYFAVSCTVFAQRQLETQPLPTALGAIARRLMLCHPLYPVLVRYGFITV